MLEAGKMSSKRLRIKGRLLDSNPCDNIVGEELGIDPVTCTPEHKPPCRQTSAIELRARVVTFRWTGWVGTLV